ncbi:MAG: DNA polymerase III subunit alpha, partial [Pseudomonadota bacterium]
MSARFIHLRVHSAYSLLEGAIPVAKLVDATMRMDMPAVALTDRNNLFGALEFSLKAASAGVQPIIGVTLAMARPAYAQDERRLAEGRQEHDWLILLAQNESGYQNLIKLVSKAHLSGDGLTTPHIDFADLESHHEGLILLTGGIDGTLGGLIAEGKTDVAHRFLDALKTLFGDRVYVELSRHDRADEDAVETGLIDLAYALNVGLVATNQAYFLNRNQFDAHDALMCIAAGTVVDSQNRERLTPDFRLKSADEMVALFADLPEAIANSVEIAKRCAFKVQTRDPILPNFTQGKGVSETEMLEDEVAKGLEARLEAVVYPQHPDRDLGEVAAPYRERMAYELGIINQMGFPGYFLIVADFIQWAKDKGIPVGPGRGSGAGSVVAWALKITDLDPLRFNLLFERFLNPERVSMPDFDVDFCQERRDEVIRYVQEKYGDDHVAQIITFGKLKARAVLRDVGRVLNLPYPQVDGLCKLIPDDPANPTTLGKALENISELKRERRSDERVAQLMDLSLELEGLYRHASTHAAGVVIGDRPLDELIPLYRDPRSTMPVTQFDMKWVEQAGLVKFDFLGLKTLSVLRMAVEFCADRGLEIDLDHLPLDDATTYALLARGDTAGVFQLESEGMRAALAGLKPDKFEDIIALVSLYRPGPMDNIPTYINRKHGREEVDYLHPSLREVLDETYGVIIYQEQVMQIAQILAGYSLGEADLLRRAMGKKKKEEMDAQRERFSEGAARKGVDPDKATYIFDLVAKFAGYGFNKSHAAAYALVAYQTAYLKANAPVEFMAATMAFELNNTDKLAEFVEEARRMDISVLPPNVNRSQVNFSVETHEGGLAIRYALAAVKNVGKSAMEMLVGARANAEACAFSDWYDFAQRLDPLAANKRLLENLVRAGALDDLH